MARELMRILTSDGVFDVEVPDPVERSMLGSYWNHVRLFLEGDASDLEQFRDVRIAGRRLLTAPVAIVLLGHAGILEFDELYTLR